MRPILFELFGIKVYGYGMMIFLGILVGVLMLERRVKNTNYNEDDIFNVIVCAILSGVLGGKILYIITDIKEILQQPLEWGDLKSGFVIYGAIIGGALGIYLYCKKRSLNILKIFDLIIPSVAIAQGFGRIGCFLAGCCYGKATKLPIGVVFNNSPFVPPHVLRHPTQIYSAIFDFLLGIFLLCYSKKNKKEGRVFASYIIIYGVGRILVEFLRDDERGSVGVLSTSQFISLITILLGVVIFNIYKFKKSNN